MKIVPTEKTQESLSTLPDVIEAIFSHPFGKILGLIGLIALLAFGAFALWPFLL